MTAHWPVAEVDPVRRLRVLAASLPGVTYAEQYLDIPYQRVWAYVDDVETSIPTLITDVRSFRIVARDAAGADPAEKRLTAKAIGLLGNRGTFEVVLKPGWCLMQSRLVIGGMAAVPEGDGTRFAGCGSLRLPGAGLLVKTVGTVGGAQRIITKLRRELDH